MPNTILTVNQITRKALMILHSKMNFIANVNRQYDDSFAKTGGKIGSQLRIRLPNEYTVRQGINMAIQDTIETQVTLPVADITGVDLEFTSEELTLSLDDFSERILDPAVSVIAANIEAAFFAKMYKQTANVIDADATAFGFNQIVDAREMLTVNLAPPTKRNIVLPPSLASKYMKDTKGLFHAGDNIRNQYVEGEIDRTQGFSIYENTLLGVHQTGTAAKVTTYLSNGATQSGSTIVVKTGATTFLVGDVVTFAGVFAVHPETKASTGALKQFVVTANAGPSATSLAISPAIVTTGGGQNVSNAVADNSAVTKVGAGANELMTNALAWYRDAYTFATADLVLPKGVDFAYREVMDGISMSIVRDFSISNRRFPCRIDVLWGGVATRPQLGTRIHADG